MAETELHIHDLPVEVLFRVMKRLDAHSLAACAGVCRRFYGLCGAGFAVSNLQIADNEGQSLQQEKVSASTVSQFLWRRLCRLSGRLHPLDPVRLEPSSAEVVTKDFWMINNGRSSMQEGDDSDGDGDDTVEGEESEEERSARRIEQEYRELARAEAAGGLMSSDGDPSLLNTGAFSERSVRLPHLTISANLDELPWPETCPSRIPQTESDGHIMSNAVAGTNDADAAHAEPVEYGLSEYFVSLYASLSSWKKAYFWLNAEDLVAFRTHKKLASYVHDGVRNAGARERILWRFSCDAKIMARAGDIIRHNLLRLLIERERLVVKATQLSIPLDLHFVGEIFSLLVTGEYDQAQTLARRLSARAQTRVRRYLALGMSKRDVTYETLQNAVVVANLRLFALFLVARMAAVAISGVTCGSEILNAFSVARQRLEGPEIVPGKLILDGQYLFDLFAVPRIALEFGHQFNFQAIFSVFAMSTALEPFRIPCEVARTAIPFSYFALFEVSNIQEKIRGQYLFARYCESRPFDLRRMHQFAVQVAAFTNVHGLWNGVAARTHEEMRRVVGILHGRCVEELSSVLEEVSTVRSEASHAMAQLIDQEDEQDHMRTYIERLQHLSAKRHELDKQRQQLRNDLLNVGWREYSLFSSLTNFRASPYVAETGDPNVPNYESAIDERFLELIRKTGRHPQIVARYAEFLWEVKNERAKCEAVLKLLIPMNRSSTTEHGDALNLFANFLWQNWVEEYDSQTDSTIDKLLISLRQLELAVKTDHSCHYLINVLSRTGELRQDSNHCSVVVDAPALLRESAVEKSVDEYLSSDHGARFLPSSLSSSAELPAYMRVTDAEACEFSTFEASDETFESKAEAESSVFNLALCYHQLPEQHRSLRLYILHLAMTNVPNTCTLGNLAELLQHFDRFGEEESDYKEIAEWLYEAGLSVTRHVYEVVAIAICGLNLSRNFPGSEEANIWLERLGVCARIPHVRANPTSFTEAHMLLFIHHDHGSIEQTRALQCVKEQIISLGVRPNLILMFDANIKWAAQHANSSDFALFKQLVRVYNGELPSGRLDEFDSWRRIAVSPPPDQTTAGDADGILTEDPHLNLLSGGPASYGVVVTQSQPPLLEPVGPMWSHLHNLQA